MEILQENNICVYRVWNQQPTDSSLLDMALPFLQGFASLQSINLPLVVASTLQVMGKKIQKKFKNSGGIEPTTSRAFHYA